jgi:hypothetical protein
MAGKSKYADRMAKHLGAPVDAACPISRPGGTAAQIGGAVGGAVGAVAAARGKQRDSDIQLGQFGWLGVGAEEFAITKSSFTGKPTDEPLARVAYTDVTDLDVSEGKLTLRVDLDLADGRHIAFESKRHGQNKPNVEVIELLRSRCQG